METTDAAYDAWAERFGSEDYDLPADADVVVGTPEGRARTRAMLLDAAETAEERALVSAVSRDA